MTRLYELAHDYAEVAALADAGEDVAAALAAIDDAIEVKADRIGALLRNLDAECEALATEEKRLAARRKTRENARERIREYVRSSMESAGLPRIKCTAWTFTLSPHKSVRVDDEAAVPDAFKRTKTEISVDKKAILDAYKRDGECIAGASVVTNMSLTVR